MAKSKCKSILILSAVTALFIVLFCVTFLSSKASGMAVADEIPTFKISTNEGNVWLLWYDGQEIMRFEGEFFNPQTNDVASVAFKRAIDEVLENAGTTDYTLTFELPEIGYSESGASTFAYTEQRSNYSIKGIYSTVISSDVIQTLQYKATDGDYVDYILATETDGGLSFGQFVGVGEYFVRVVVYERFTFDKVNYSVPRYSVPTGCKITKAIPEIPQIDIVEVEYGTTAKDVASALPALDCSWSLSKSQTDTSITSPEVRPHVTAEAYTILFDYAPKNQNYQTVENVAVKVKFAPKILRVAIADAYSFIGEEMADINSYEIITPLVEGDSQSDLGITLVCESFDKNTAGMYLITANFSNTDYTAQCINQNSAFIYGGRYMVYAIVKTVKAPDGTEFKIMLDDGFRDVTVRVELYDFDIADNKGFVIGYEFFFETPSGERVYPAGGFAVEWDESDIIANSVGFVLEGGFDGKLTQLTHLGISVPQDTRAILFFNAIPSLNDGAKEVACIVLASLCGVFGAVLIALIAVYMTRRRYFA